MSTEYPELTRRFFEKQGHPGRHPAVSYGATEAKVPDIVDCIVDITETGRAFRAAGLKVIAEILTSYTELIANPGPPPTRPSATPWTRSRPCSTACWRRAARCS